MRYLNRLNFKLVCRSLGAIDINGSHNKRNLSRNIEVIRRITAYCSPTVEFPGDCFLISILCSAEIQSASARIKAIKSSMVVFITSRAQAIVSNNCLPKSPKAQRSEAHQILFVFYQLLFLNSSATEPCEQLNSHL